MDNDFFNMSPTTNIKRVEAINVLAETINKFDSKKESLNIDFPFLDININNQNRESINFCLQQGLISKSHKFYPDKLITKAELIKILSNSQKTKKIIKLIFDE